MLKRILSVLLCAALLLAVAVSLTAAMLWQVREQSALHAEEKQTKDDLNNK